MYKITEDDIDFCDAYVYKLCRKLGRVSDDDAKQCGRLGLVTASHKFDPDRNDNFKGYATWWIRTYLYRDYFGFGCTRKDASSPMKKLGELHDICYTDNCFEDEVLNKVTAEKCLGLISEDQRFVFEERFYNDKSCYDMEREFGKRAQAYDLRFQRAKKIIKRRIKEI